jgi:hypothetical protein
MAIIVVGGHSRNVGKTSVVAGLIRAFNNYPWTAIKITSHWHESTPAAPECARENIFDVYEEVDRSGTSDTSRYLAAGASRALWVRIKDDPAETSLQQLVSILQSCPFAIIESNRIINLLRPDLFIMVLRYDIDEFKPSARKVLKKANAAVVVNSNPSQPPWKNVEPEILSGIRLFATIDARSIPQAFLDFVRTYLPQQETSIS